MSGSPTVFLVLALTAFAGSIAVAFFGSRYEGRHTYRQVCRERALFGITTPDPLPFSPSAVPDDFQRRELGAQRRVCGAAPKTSDPADGAGRLSPSVVIA